MKFTHERNVTHGDVKCENVLMTSTNWIFLSDFASFKPKSVPADNPADFTFYFDAGGRRRCYLAPERFVDSNVNTNSNNDSNCNDNVSNNGNNNRNVNIINDIALLVIILILKITLLLLALTIIMLTILTIMIRIILIMI